MARGVHYWHVHPQLVSSPACVVSGGQVRGAVTRTGGQMRALAVSEVWCGAESCRGYGVGAMVDHGNLSSRHDGATVMTLDIVLFCSLASALLTGLFY